MGIFSKDEPVAPAPWTPTVDLVAARQVVLDLIYATNTPGTPPEQIEQLVFRFGEISGTPTDPMDLMGRFPPDSFDQVLQRPWFWLDANARHAASAGDLELVAIAAFWTHQWRNLLQPKFGTYERQFWLVSEVPPEVLQSMRQLGPWASAQLPPGHVLFGNETGQITAGFLADNIESLLS